MNIPEKRSQKKENKGMLYKLTSVIGKHCVEWSLRLAFSIEDQENEKSNDIPKFTEKMQDLNVRKKRF